MLKITRRSPGENDDRIDPVDFGFEIIHAEPADESEAARIAILYAQVKERTGVEITRIEHYLAGMERHLSGHRSRQDQGC
jgi:hypothetical protein